jgi:flagellum-specific ATP synthase
MEQVQAQLGPDDDPRWRPPHDRRRAAPVDLGAVPVATLTGRLVGASGLLLESTGCPFHTGQRCRIEAADGRWIDAQAVGFRNEVSYLMPLKQADGLATGARVLPATDNSTLRIGPSWLGRIVNGLGEPIDGLGRLDGEQVLQTRPPKVNPLKKTPVRERWTWACAPSTACSRWAAASAWA